MFKIVVQLKEQLGSDTFVDLPDQESYDNARDMLKNRTSPAGIWLSKWVWVPWHRVVHILIAEEIQGEE